MLTVIVNMSVVVATRIPKELKKQMEAHPEVDWSKTIRDAIGNRLREEELKKARAIEDRLREKTRGTSHTIVARVVREERDSR